MNLGPNVWGTKSALKKELSRASRGKKSDAVGKLKPINVQHRSHPRFTLPQISDKRHPEGQHFSPSTAKGVHASVLEV